MQQVFVAGDEPIPGYRLLDEIEGSAFFKVWRVQTPEGALRWWKIIDLVVGNAAIETRTLGLLVRLRHPHLNTLTNFWNLDDGKTLIIESEVPVRSLRDVLKQCQNQGNPGLSLSEIAAYVEQAAQGLDFLNRPAHEYNGQQVAIYHRSLRPDCLLLFEEGPSLVCRVSDFGLSKPVTEEVAQHSQGLVHYDYDPPEFFEGQTSPTSDQYALAVVYCELRTGQLPFQGTMLDQLQARLNDRPDLSRFEEPERGIIKKALSRDPAQRYKSCTEFVSHLKEGKAPDGASAGAVTAARAESSSRPSGATSISAPTPSKSASTAPGWRSATAAATARPASAPLTPTMTPPPGGGVNFQRPGQKPAYEMVATVDSTVINGKAAAEPRVAASSSRPASKTPSKLPSGADLKSIREHIAATSLTFTDQYTGERKVPLTWVAVILMLTAVGSVWISKIMAH